MKALVSQLKCNFLTIKKCTHEMAFCVQLLHCKAINNGEFSSFLSPQTFPSCAPRQLCLCSVSLHYLYLFLYNVYERLACICMDVHYVRPEMGITSRARITDVCKAAMGMLGSKAWSSGKAILCCLSSPRLTFSGVLWQNETHWAGLNERCLPQLRYLNT